MVRTIGILGPNGRVGSATAQHLLKASSKGEVKLVLIGGRKGSAAKIETKEGVDVREVDLDGASVEEIAEVLDGLNVLIFALSFDTFALQFKLIQALSKIKGFELFIPGLYSKPFGPQDAEKNSNLGPVVGGMSGLLTQSKDLGISTVVVHTGNFEEFYMTMKFLGSDVNENIVQANQKQKKNKLPITTMDYLGAVLAKISSDPTSYTNKTVSAVDIWATGSEIIQAFKNANEGKEPEIIDYTSEDLENEGKSQDKLVKSAYMSDWQDDSWTYPDSVEVEGYGKKTVDEVAKKWKK